MSTELVKQEHGELTVQQSPENFLSVIAQAAANPAVDVAKMEALLGMQERILAKQAEAAFNEAMTRLQPKLPRITKNARIEFKGTIQSRYAKYEDIDAAVRPLLCEEGFSIAFDSEFGEKLTIITATLSHVQGHSKKASIPLPLDTSGSKNNIQGMGSVVSYGRRYLLSMLLNIITVDADDDGNAISTIDQDQANRINDLLLETKSNRAKFLEVMGVPEVEKILRKDYQRAMDMLAYKQRRAQP